MTNRIATDRNRRKIKENQRNVGVAGRHGISGGFGVEPCSLWGFGVERAGWFGNVGCAAVGFAAGPQREGNQPWGGRAHMERLGYLRPVPLTAARN